MRKIGIIIAILLFTIACWARVDINCTSDDNEVTVSYNVVDEPHKVRLFALDITVDNSARITAVGGYKAGESVAPDDLGYGIFPGSFDLYINPDDPNWEDPNYTPLADPCDYPSDTQPGLGSNGITIEMGSFYSPTDDNSPNAPDNEGVLLKFYVDNDCNVTITENIARGGVVLTDPSQNISDFNAPVHKVELDCFPKSYSTYNTWVELGKPDCWCAPPYGDGYQCDGDASDSEGGIIKKIRVYTDDLGLLIDNWMKHPNDPTLDPCADIDHKSQGKIVKYQVYTKDLGIIIDNWMKQSSELPGDCPRPE